MMVFPFLAKLADEPGYCSHLLVYSHSDESGHCPRYCSHLLVYSQVPSTAHAKVKHS
jgi:hypothetical protein